MIPSGHTDEEDVVVTGTAASVGGELGKAVGLEVRGAVGLGVAIDAVLDTATTSLAVSMLSSHGQVTRSSQLHPPIFTSNRNPAEHAVIPPY